MMAKQYKAWMEIEEYDDETDQHANIDHEVEPMTVWYDSIENDREAMLEAQAMFLGPEPGRPFWDNDCLLYTSPSPRDRS